MAPVCVFAEGKGQSKIEMLDNLRWYNIREHLLSMCAHCLSVQVTFPKVVAMLFSGRLIA